MLYLLCDQCIKESFSRASKVFVSFQNLSLEEDIQGQDIGFKVGVMSSSKVNNRSVADIEQAVYLHTSDNVVVRCRERVSCLKATTFAY